MKQQKLVAALACRMNGSRLYGKPIQNLDVQKEITILDNIIKCLMNVAIIDEIVLGIAEGKENEIFQNYAERYALKHIVGDEVDVLGRLIKCGEVSHATDIFRVTTESPFVNYELIPAAWDLKVKSQSDGVFLDEVIDGIGFEIVSMSALKNSHLWGSSKHRSEMCTLYIRENISDFKIVKFPAPKNMIRPDLRLTVDNPEDLVICRKIFKSLGSLFPNIPLDMVIEYLDANPSLIELTKPFVESGYSTMYI